MRVRIGVANPVVFYAPFHVALRRGLFAAEGLEVEYDTIGATLYDRLATGELQAGVGGIMRSLVAYDQGVAAPPVHFANINDRDGFYLIGRPGPFDWPDLIGKRLLVFTAPTPWYLLRAFLKRRGLDPDQVRAEPWPLHEMPAALRSGSADYVLTMAHIVEEMIADGSAAVLRASAQELGPVPFSSYCADRGYMTREPAVIAAIARANANALRWMRSVDGDAIWEAIRPSFADGDAAVLARAVGRIHADGAWSSPSTLPPDSFNRLAGPLHAGGLISRVAPYDRVIDDTAARAAEGEGER